MDESVYYKTAIPEPWTILGLRLKPFSLGHVIILHRFESPFVSDIKRSMPADLLFAVFICSNTYEEDIAALDDPRLYPWIASWSGKLCLPTWRHKLGFRKAVDIDWGQKFMDFGKYMQEGSHYPGFCFQDTGQSEEVGLPLVQIVKCVLLTKTSLSESQILNRPWGMALTDYITIRAMDGAVRIVDLGDIQQAKDQAKEFYDRMMKGSDGARH